MNQSAQRAHLAAITSTLSEGRVQDASRCLEAALADAPGSLPLQLLKARLLEKSGEFALARDHCEGLRSTFPTSPRPEKLLANLALKQAEPVAAAQYAAAAERKGLPAAELCSLQVRIAEAREDLPAQRHWLERLVSLQEVPDTKLLFQLARVRAKQGDRGGEREALDQVLAVEPGNVKAQAAIARAAMAIGDLEGAQRAFEALPSESDDPALISDRCFVLHAAGRSEEANSLVRIAILRGLRGFSLFRKMSAAVLPEDLVQQFVEWAESVRPDASPGERAKAAEVLADCGRPIPAHLLAMAPTTGPGSRGLSRLDWLQHAPHGASLKRPVLGGSSDEEVIVARSERPEAVALVFTGLADRAMVPLPSLDRYLAALDLSAVYLRDFRRLLFVDGIASKAPDFAGTVRWLRELVESWGARRIVSLGTSAGGYAALRYGLALGAESVVAFSAPTNLRADFNQDDGRARLVAKKVQALPADQLDIRPFVEAAAGRTPIHLVYGARMRQDAHHAHHLAGLPGVHLHPIESLDEHGSLVWMARHGKLLPFLHDKLA